VAGGARGPIVLVALVVVAYLPFIGGGFLTDDFVHLDRLSQIRTVGDVVNAPDAFGFFRPVTQATLFIEALIHPSTAPLFRLTNVVLQALVLMAAFGVSRLLLAPSATEGLPSVSAAALATLIFALTPKAHPIAVLWISARGELLMALFALAATWGWIMWTRGGRRAWLMTALVAYALATMSKETAFLLPLALLVAPGSTIPWRRRLVAASAMVAVATLVFLWRLEAGALVPSTSDEHYMLATPLFRWWRNARNYFGRLVPEPLMAVIFVAIFAAAERGWRTVASGFIRMWEQKRVLSGFPPTASVREIALFAIAWMSVFLVPVLPVVARNELYLYLPAFGLSLLAAQVIESSVDLSRRSLHVWYAIMIFAVAGGLYQASRSREMHDELVFSGKLVDSLASTKGPGAILLIGEDGKTRQLLKDTIADYLPAVLRLAAPDGRLIAAGSEQPDAPGVIRVRCSYHDDRLVFARN
jgi:hypothetical protein